MNTHESYVSLTTAKMLKEAGFDWEGTSYYQYGVFYPYKIDRERLVIMNQSSAPSYMEQYSAPTLDVAQRWLREVKNYYVSVDVNCDSIGVFYTVRYVFHDGDKYNASYIWEDTEMNIVKHRRIFDNFEEAQEAGIKIALELILEKGCNNENNSIITN